MHRSVLLLETLLPALAESPSDRIGVIDFYGYGTLNAASLREMLPFHEGDTIPSDAVQNAAMLSMRKTAGREAVFSIAGSLRQHRELILNYFRAQKLISSGVVEGLNNKAKVTMRKSYGFRTYRVLELALYHSLGKLPEPELTHRFF
jgi:hypothetical protein